MTATSPSARVTSGPPPPLVVTASANVAVEYNRKPARFTVEPLERRCLLSGFTTLYDFTGGAADGGKPWRDH